MHELAAKRSQISVHMHRHEHNITADSAPVAATGSSMLSYLDKGVEQGTACLVTYTP